MSIKAPKKLIEVALPLDAINEASGKEKSIRQGHPSTLHLWWARRPLATARAVIFAQMVNDPGYERSLGRGVNKDKALVERERLFKIIEDLVKWENTNNEEILGLAREEIWKSWRETCRLNRDHPQAAELFNPEKLPAFHDPFAGGGALPMEAQRLGLEAYGSDLNPVAVTICKAMIEIPPKFAGRPPVGPRLPSEKQGEMHQDWSGARGLAEDVRRYGAWMRAEAEKRIGHLYPPVEVTNEMAQGRTDLKPLIGQKLTVIAWLWARTIRSPNPAFSNAEVPLVSSFVICSKEGKQAYVKPVVDGQDYRFTVKTGTPPKEAANGTKLARGANFRCILSDSPIEPKHIYAEANAGRMGARLMAIVAEGKGGRLYLPPTAAMEAVALQAKPNWKSDVLMPENARWFSPPLYGLKTYGDLFTSRQLVALATFSDLVKDVISKCHADAVRGGLTDDNSSLEAGGTGACAYSHAIGVYVSLAVDKAADYNSTICGWISGGETLRNTFGRQAIPMVWDYCEANITGDMTGSFYSVVAQITKAIQMVPALAGGHIFQADATNTPIAGRVVSTDPPYYDNIGYADLSDFFYVWLRRSLRPVLPALFSTLAVPKAEELIASSYRHGGREAAESFFLSGMTAAMRNVAQNANAAFPITIYYAFKQSDTSDDSGTASTGWETFLDAVLRAGFGITGTWPMRTERDARAVGIGVNALASSIILVCRQRPHDAATVSRREFIRELNAALPDALDEMTRGGVNSPVAPVDLSQAIIGPGMAIFSKYKSVLEADGTPMSVRTALTLINRFFAEDDFDHDTQFCLHWFDRSGWAIGRFGEADVLARSKGTAVNGLVQAGVVESSGGNLRLFRWAEYPADWAPESDRRASVWEALHQLIRALNQQGDSAAGGLLARMPEKAEPVRALAYRLYTLCERKGWAEDARAYNELITSWAGIEAASHETGHTGTQTKLEL